MTNARPDPDALLAQVTAQAEAARRGRLRIYFGASAGVGKTYAMLTAARALRGEGKDVVVGLLETHGRKETEALLQGLEVLPRAQIAFQDRTLPEFDLDGALARHPALILVDELAHTNVPGARHPKRWQDIDELLAAGIDVYSTLNVQHIESLNDVVGGITGIKVWETVPDFFFDKADEVVMVDVSADDLLGRLAAGKVYLPEQIERAAKNFFRKGNLMALRELALRRTADRVEEDVQAYRSDKSIERVWKTEDSLLCCIGPGPGGEDVVRSAARLASQLGVDWTAVYVETRTLQRLPTQERERILRTVKLAQEFGARTSVLSGGDAAAEIIEYARTHNCSKLVVGRKRGAANWPWARGTARRIGELAPDIDLIEVGRSTEQPVAAQADRNLDDEADPRRGAKRLRYLWALLACLVTTLVCTPLLPYFDLANIVMLFLLAVVLVAVKWGRGPAVLAAFVSVASFDFFFVPPRFTFAVSDFQYLLTFAVMLIVALIIGQMTAGLRYQARVASYREERARVLYEFARDMSSLLLTGDVVEAATKIITNTFGAKVAILVPDSQDRIRPTAGSGPAGGHRYRRRAVGVRQGAAGGRRHRHPRGERIPVLASARADAHAGRAGDQAGQSTIATRTRTTQAPRHLRRTDRHRPRTRALRGGRAAGAHPHGVRTSAQLAALGAFARSAHSAGRRRGTGGIAGADQAAHVTGAAGIRERHRRRGAPDERAGQQPARDGANRKR